MTDTRLARYRTCYTSVIHDILRAKGRRNFTLPPRIRPLQPEMTLCGPAWTVEGRVDETADPHETLLAWTGLLSKAKPGHIWTTQPHTHAIAQMGELSAETLRDKGVRGAVVDGMIRDANFLLELGFQTWHEGYTPRDIVGWWLPAATEAEIRIGEVDIEPGDYLVGDRDGLIRVPKGIIEDVLEKAEAAISTESEIRKAIRAGVDPQQAYLKYGKF